MSKNKGHKTCPTGKIRYRDEISVMLGLASAHSKNRDETRYYRCPSCRGWHLTSRGK